ncbi:hypothetical protein B2H94_08920 [Clostridium sporogenes]|uniref:Uncharacterized protein n=1 Tax=Clostridium sporogenes TaxID=1509 RepID=A0ABD6RS05_CLOSG|nr:hypothetical protein [Clostridium sporogenes]OSB19204.1 hypothetical protein B2H94_08920 [Clostridium sporogenes]
MANYKAENSQIGAFGEHAVSNGNKFEQRNVMVVDNYINLKGVCKELEVILNKINSKQDKNSEDYRFLANIMEIYETAQKNNKKDTIAKIQKYATNLFYTMATGVGTGIIANIVSKALGI